MGEAAVVRRLGRYSGGLSFAWRVAKKPLADVSSVFPNRVLLSRAAVREPTMQVRASCFLYAAIRLLSHPGDGLLPSPGSWFKFSCKLLGILLPSILDGLLPSVPGTRDYAREYFVVRVLRMLQY